LSKYLGSIKNDTIFDISIENKKRAATLIRRNKMATSNVLFNEKNEVVKFGNTSVFVSPSPVKETQKAVQLEILFVSEEFSIGSSHLFWVPKSICKTNGENITICDWFIQKEIFKVYNQVL